MLKILLIMPLYFLLSQAVFAEVEIYQCKDHDGVINFTSIPCGEKEYGIRYSDKKAESNPDGTKKTVRQINDEKLKKEKEYLDASRRKKEAEKIKKLKLQQHARKVRMRCNEARQSLKDIQNAGSLYNRDKNNKKITLTAQQHKKAERDAQRQITYWCR